MRSFSTFVAFAAAVVCSVRGESYPPEYPFENEAVVVPFPMKSTPGFTYDDSDPGGYYYEFFVLLTEIPEFPYTFSGGGAEYYNFAVRKEVATRPPKLPEGTFNCTAKGPDYIMTAATFPGNIAGQKVVCEGGECCKLWHNTPTFWDGAEDTWMLDNVLEEQAAGVCTGEWIEQVYCLIMDQSQTTNCIEYVIDQTARLNNRMNACYDARYILLTSCPVYMATGLYYDGNEPPSYFEASTPEELNAHTSIFISPDKICHPYSYFFPDFAKSQDSLSSVSGSGSAASESKSETSSAAWISITAVIGIFLNIV